MSSEAFQTLSLTELLETLEHRGISMSLSALSAFCKTGDIPELLHVGGNGSRLEFPPAAADVIAAFWPEFKAAKGKLVQAPAMLRSFLKPENSNDTALVPTVTQLSRTLELPSTEAMDRYADALVRHADALHALPPPDDALLTISQAHEAYGVPVAVLRGLRVKIGSRVFVKRSRVLAYIAGL